MKSLITSTISTFAAFSVVCFGADDPAVEPFIPGATPQIREFEGTKRHADEQFRNAEKQFRNAEKQFRKMDEKVRVAEESEWHFKEKANQFAQAATSAAGFGGDVFLSADGDPLQRASLNLQSIITGPAKAAFRPLIVRTGKEDPSVIEELQEDLSVMSRILTKAVGPETGRPAEDWVMGIAVTTLGGPRSPQSMYLEGFGALFLASVKFPLVAPPKPELEAKPATEKDATWEEAKQELFGDGNVRRYRNPAGQRPKIDYSAERVSDLRESLLEALKSAKNIRHLKADEWITVVVTGGDNESGAIVKSAVRAEAAKAYPKAKDTYSKGNAGSDKEIVVRAVRAGGGESSQLVIRVKKSDVDAFASGKLTAEDFAKQAQIATY